MAKKENRKGWRVNEYCEMYGISRPTFHKWMSMGLRTRKVGGMRLILKEDDEQFMAQFAETS